MAYKKETDYQALINQAVAEGNMIAAAGYEQQRNEKIAGEGLGYEQTNKYAQYLPQQQESKSDLYDTKTDYKGLLDAAMNAGSTDADYLQGLLNSRMAKVQDPNYSKYDNPEYHAYVQGYINDLKNQNAIDIDALLAQIGGYTGNAPKYSSSWDSVANQLANQVLGMNYDDFLKGDQYGKLSDRYAQNGARAMRDVLGQMSARTGGLASSYAEAVAQQQYNDYMSKLEDAARAMYDAERGNAVQNAQMALNMSNNDYGRYQDELAQYNNDRSYITNLISNMLANQQSQSDKDYNRSLDKAQLIASATGDYSGYKDLGYTDDEISALNAAAQAAAEAQAAKTTGSRSSGTKTGKDNETPDEATKWNAVEDWVRKYGPDAAEDYVAEHYKDLGYGSASAAQAGWNNHMREIGGMEGLENTGSGAGSSKTFTDRDSAIAYLKRNGVSAGELSKILSRPEWEARKKTYNKYGSALNIDANGVAPDNEIRYYNTYEDYLNSYVRYLMETK